MCEVLNKYRNPFTRLSTCATGVSFACGARARVDHVEPHDDKHHDIIESLRRSENINHAMLTILTSKERGLDIFSTNMSRHTGEILSWLTVLPGIPLVCAKAGSKVDILDNH